MALNIKDPETDRLARELASLTGESITTALREAVRARIAWAQQQRAALQPPSGDLFEEIARIGRDLPVLDEGSMDDYLYGEDGLPR